mmetsp:Transcript_7952/g.12540  ORF Transcript_7952/g.12540 Transcript_7952/m.12540 type:complete len:85 (+) Transcript_7952:445-699(+)
MLQNFSRDRPQPSIFQPTQEHQIFTNDHQVQLTSLLVCRKKRKIFAVLLQTGQHTLRSGGFAAENAVSQEMGNLVTNAEDVDHI